MRILFIALLTLCLSACGFVGFPGVYRINIEQGNIVTQEMVDQLQPGMSKRQVRFIMGTPLVEDSFNLDRWDYVYVLRNGLEPIDDSRLTVFFENDAMSHYTGSFNEEFAKETEQPPDQIPAQAPEQTPEQDG